MMISIFHCLNTYKVKLNLGRGDEICELNYNNLIIWLLILLHYITTNEYYFVLLNRANKDDLFVYCMSVL